jgi:hypothetical protein
MKRCQSLLICALAIFSVSANSTGTRPLPPFATFTAHPATAAPGLDFTAQAALSAGRLRGASTTQANFTAFSGHVVKDIRATSVFVQDQAIKAATPNGWLIALAAFGLVVLQLRRKHRSLPQRRIAPYG